MSVKLSDFVFTVSRVSPRRPPTHAWRRAHQAVACLPQSQPASVFDLSSDTLHAIYHDLMTLDPTPTQASQSGLDLRVEVPYEPADTMLADCAKQGKVQEFESAMSRLPATTEHQRDLHVKAHINHASLSAHLASPPTTRRFPTSALAVLHQYEASGQFAPIKSYTRVISALFNVETYPFSDPRLGRAAAQAQAWDLFSHMRYVAHPVPDAHLYALMIRACGSFSRPEPERALDLWIEMQENGIEPTRGAYEAVIKVCGRAGPEWLGEGMKLAREMSERHPISGTSGRGLWSALLEGCKRAGDLKTARWILAEAVRGSSDRTNSQLSMVDADFMTHIFQAYASYQTPFKRETTRLIDCSPGSNGQGCTTQTQKEEISSRRELPSIEQAQDANAFHPEVPVENVNNIPSFSRLPPQTSADVVAETRALFDRICRDRYPSIGEACNFPQGGLLAGRFAHVELTPVLLNAYLSVFYRHASIETSQEVFDTLFGQCSSSTAQILRPDEYTYINSLERCAIARVEERHIAARWAEKVWRRWEVAEAKGLRDGRRDVGSFARLVERAHAAMRRVLILSGDIDGALALLRTFVSRYPPNEVLPPNPTAMAIRSPLKSTGVRLFAKPSIFSTRTALTNSARPLVRLSSAVSPRDDCVPPIIAFSDVDLLHARSAEHSRIKDLGYIKWVCMAYSNALKKRRDAFLTAAPTRDEQEVD